MVWGYTVEDRTIATPPIRGQNMSQTRWKCVTHGVAAQLLIVIVMAPAGTATAAPVQTDDGAFTRYELLAPASHAFRIVYDITATTPGATTYFNPIRTGSIATNEHVTDRASGAPLTFTEVDGIVARAGGVANAAPENRYIAVTLARPVPEGGGSRIRIDKTYEDAKSYYADGDGIVFDRSLGIKRNTVVLPTGYRLAAVNVPVQVLQQPDGRIAVSFWNASPVAMPLVIRALPTRAPVQTGSSQTIVGERAEQTREIVYYLRAPETHSFDLTHDYTEERPGVGAYVNVVRAGSTVSNPSARDLDTGANLPVEMVHGAAITAIDPRETKVTAATTAVIFRFPPVTAEGSRRIRIAETYTDPVRYTVSRDELVWHRAFGRPANAVVLPSGWLLTNSTIPATVSLTPDGRTRLDFINPRPDEIDVVITARRAE
jgi:hypothetical protein